MNLLEIHVVQTSRFRRANTIPVGVSLLAKTALQPLEV
jgi:hypothetical protein